MIQRNPAKLMAFAVLSAPLSIWAQDSSVGGQAEPSATPQTSVIQRVEIVGRQGSTELRRAASVAKQIYGREELDRYGDTNALDVMRRLPGVNIDSGGPRMRGLGAGYTQILINGDPAPQGFNLDQLSPSQIERIEVLRAPTAEQSAQAVAGSINIILKEAPRRSQSNLTVSCAIKLIVKWLVPMDFQHCLSKWALAHHGVGGTTLHRVLTSSSAMSKRCQLQHFFKRAFGTTAPITSTVP